MSIAIGSVTTGWSNAAMVIDSEGEDTLAMPIKKRVVIKRAIGKAMHIWYTRKPHCHATHVQNPLTDSWRGGGISMGLRWFCLCNSWDDSFQMFLLFYNRYFLTIKKAKNKLSIEVERLKYCKIFVDKLSLTPNIRNITLLSVNCGKASVVASKNETLLNSCLRLEADSAFLDLSSKHSNYWLYVFSCNHYIKLCESQCLYSYSSHMPFYSPSCIWMHERLEPF